MKTLYAIVLTLLFGCATATNNKHPALKLLPQIKAAAFAGTHEALIQEPAWRGRFESAIPALTILESAEKVSFDELLAVVLTLPVRELKSEQAILIITTAGIMLDDLNDSFDLSAVGLTQKIAGAIRQGIELGLKTSKH